MNTLLMEPDFLAHQLEGQTDEAILRVVKNVVKATETVLARRHTSLTEVQLRITERENQSATEAEPIRGDTLNTEDTAPSGSSDDAGDSAEENTEDSPDAEPPKRRKKGGITTTEDLPQ